MSDATWLRRSTRWFRLLLRLYPMDFRDEMGDALVETYRDRSRAALARGGVPALLLVWMHALVDSIRNGPGERAHPAVRWRRSGNWGRDMEMTLRRMARAPVFVVSLAGTLTAGLGAFAVVFAAVYRVLLAPLPYERPEDLYFVWRDITWISFPRGWLAGTDVVQLQKSASGLTDVVGMRNRTATLSGTAAGEPMEISLTISNPGLFDVLGAHPALGRGFQPDEGGAGRPPVIVLTHALWNRLGAETAIIGRVIRLDGQPYTVIGVMDRSFDFMMHQSLGAPTRADAYVTFPFDLATTSPKTGSFAALVRARPGASPSAVAATVGAAGRVVDERDFERRGLRLYPVSLRSDLVSRVKPALTALGIAGGFLVAVLLANLATLLLARAAQREQQYAVARALGANGGALARAIMFEGAVLGTLGGAGGALVAVWGTRVLVGLAPADLPRLDAIRIDWPIALAVVTIGAVLGLLAGAVPAIWAARSSLSSLLNSAAVRGGAGPGRMRRSMVVVQIALSLVLLSSGALVVRSFERLLSTNAGFDPAGVLTFRIPVPRAAYANDTVVNALHERIQNALQGLPGVTAVGAVSALPLSSQGDQSDVAFPGAPGNNGDREHDSPLVDYLTTRAGYFEALGIRVVAGRAFAPTRTPGVREALIDRTLAATFFPATSPVGRTLVLGRDTLSIIGVVEHARLYDVHKDGRGQAFVRNEDFTYNSLSWAVRASRPPDTLVPEVRSALHGVDPELALAATYPMQELVGESLRQQRLSAVLIGGFSVGALLLAAMGLFGVVSSSVTRRRHELAVRLALGADSNRVLRLVLGEGAALVAIGCVLGAPGIYVAGRVIRGTLVGVSPFDPPTLVAVAAGLALVAMTACWFPARRVTTIDPSHVLRGDE